MKRTILTLAAAASLALGTTACDVDEPGKDAGKVEVKASKPAKKGKKGTSKPGKAESDDTLGGFTILGDVKPVDDGLGDYSARFRVRNDGDSARDAWFKITVLNGSEIYGVIDCMGPDAVQPGQTATVECWSTDKFRNGWRSLEIVYDGI